MVLDHDYKVVVEPAEEPVRLSMAKAHLQIGSPDDDDYIDYLIKASREQAEQECRRAFITQTIELRFDRFPRGRGALEVYPNPVQSVESIAYVDLDGVGQTLDPADYTVNLREEPCQIYPAYGKTWPDVIHYPRSVTVQFVAGFGDTADEMPAKVKNAMYFLISDKYENRLSTIIGTSVSVNSAAYQNAISQLQYGMIDGVV